MVKKISSKAAAAKSAAAKKPAARPEVEYNLGEQSFEKNGSVTKYMGLQIVWGDKSLSMGMGKLLALNELVQDGLFRAELKAFVAKNAK